MSLDWPKDRRFADGSELVMEGNLTSDTEPFSVVWLTKAGSIIVEKKFATHAEGLEFFKGFSPGTDNSFHGSDIPL